MYIALPNQRTEKLTSAIERPYSHHHLNISTTAWGHDCLYPMHSGELITRLLRAEELLPRKGGGRKRELRIANATGSAAFMRSRRLDGYECATMYSTQCFVRAA